MDDKPRVHLESRAQWRAWLEANHAVSSGVWLVTWRRRTGKPTIIYEEAIQEALCFGWIDGQTGKGDDERSAQWYAPRRPRSTWARTNKERVARLEAAGLMTEAGRRAVEVARANGTWEALDKSDALVVPDDLAAALAERPGAREHFDAAAASVRKMALAWVYLPKRPETRADHVARIAATCERREPLFSVFQRREQGRE